MPMIFCHLPLPQIRASQSQAANADCLQSVEGQTLSPPMVPSGNVRLLRRAHEQDRNRFILSGKLADVCQALEQLASEEMRCAAL